MKANKRVELLAVTTDFTDAQIEREAGAMLSALSDHAIGQTVEFDVRRADKQMFYQVVFTCDDADFRAHGAGGELIDFPRGYYQSHASAVAAIERTIAEVNDEKDPEQGDTLIAFDAELKIWTDGCESFFIETTALMD